MKRLLLLCVACCVATAYAQDVVVKRDGSTILAKVLEVNQTDIKYKKYSNQQGPTYTINKSDVMAINYEGGEKDVFDSTTTKGGLDNRSNGAYEKRTPTPEDIAANKSVLSAWMNSDLPGFEGDTKDKRPNILYCLLRPTHDSYIADANVELSFKCFPIINKDWNNITGSNLVVVVKNKTTKTIYIDLGNTFIIRGNYSEPYFIPSAVSSTQGTHSGYSINLGSVASAMGIGGGLGTVAGGINVGAGSTDYKTTTVYAQRVIAVPPMSSKNMEPIAIIPPDGNEYEPTLTMKGIRRHHGPKFREPHIEGISSPTTIGIPKLYREGDIPFNSSILLTYSFYESIAEPYTLHTKFYVRQITGMPKNKGTFFEAMPKYFSPQQLNDVFVLLWQDN